MTLNLPDDYHIIFWTNTWGLPYSLLREKVDQNCISVRKKTFFLSLYLSTIYVLKKSLYNFQNNGQYT